METDSERIVRQWREGPLEAMPSNILLESAQKLQSDNDRLRTQLAEAWEAMAVMITPPEYTHLKQRLATAEQQRDVALVFVQAVADDGWRICDCGLRFAAETATASTPGVPQEERHYPGCIVNQAHYVLASVDVSVSEDSKHSEIVPNVAALGDERSK